MMGWLSYLSNEHVACAFCAPESGSPPCSTEGHLQIPKVLVIRLRQESLDRFEYILGVPLGDKGLCSHAPRFCSCHGGTGTLALLERSERGQLKSQVDRLYCPRGKAS